jgi:hypothetical protein
LQKSVRTDKEGNYIQIKGMIQQDVITIINMYGPDIGAPKFIKQTL